MATTKYGFRGVSYWAKVHNPDPRFDVYTLDLYLDEANLNLLKRSGLELKLRESENGTYVKFKRPTKKIIKGNLVTMGPPSVFLKTEDGKEAFEGNVGNGSVVEALIAVYDTPKGKGHTLESVIVYDLVPYEANDIIRADASDQSELPF